MARVARADGRLQVCFPAKLLNEVLHVFQTRFNLHVELYQVRKPCALKMVVVVVVVVIVVAFLLL